MKLSLRNFALAGALAVAGSVMAQDAPFTVVNDWAYIKEGITPAETRGGTGFNNKIYAPDRVAGFLKVYNADGTVEDLCPLEGAVVGATHDEAGNILLNYGWPGAGCWSTWQIVEPDGTSHTMTLTLPEDAVGGRMDFGGRVAGNVLSEEGAIMYFAPNSGSAPFFVYVKNGEQADFAEEFGLRQNAYVSSHGGFLGFDSTTIAQPLYSFEEYLDIIDEGELEIADLCAVRKRANLVPYYYSADDEEFVKTPQPAGTRSSEGFDVFTLGGETYYVIPCGDLNYTSRFAIINVNSAEILYQVDADLEVSQAAGQGFGQICANKVDEHTVEIYAFAVTVAGTNKCMYGKWTVSDGGAAPAVLKGDANGDGEVSVADVVYVCNAAVGAPAADLVAEAADVDGDGDVTVTDVVLVVNLILGADPAGAPAKVVIKADSEDTGSLYVEDIKIAAGGEAEVEILLDTPDYDVTAFQFNMTLPEGLDVYAEDGEYIFDLADRCPKRSGHQIQNNRVNGEFIVLCYSSKSVNFDDREGAVALFTLEAAADFNGGDIEIYGVEVVEKDGTKHKLGAVTVKVTETTGVELVGADNAPAVYYNLQGVRVANPNNGVFVKVQGGKAVKVVK